MTAGFIEFEFDLPEALLTSIVDVFGHMTSAPLLLTNVALIPEAQGVYMLLLHGQVVYIGKTDADAGLRRRLERHARTIQHRLNLESIEVEFKAVRVFVFTAMDLETQLIRHYSNITPLRWNFSGFGSNDPGRERDTTNLKPEGFDATYPINIERQLDIVLPADGTAAEIIALVKAELPYTFRVEGRGRGSRQPHPDLDAARVTLPDPPFNVRMLIQAVVRTLPVGWQATALAGRIILYRETRDYPFGRVIARS